MATSILAAAAPALISGGISYVGNKLFGSGSKSAQAPLQAFKPTGINAGGLSTSFSGDNLNIKASPERLGFVSNVANTFGGLNDELSALRARVAPGISELRSSRLGEIEDARRRAIGDLRENLQRRRVLGSSFGNDAITRAESEFAGQRDRVAAESFLQELEATNNLVQQEFTARRQQFQTGLDELNLEASLAAGLATKATDAMGSNARLEAQLNMLEAQNAGKFFGQTFGPAAQAIGTSAGKGISNFVNVGSFAGSGFNGSGLPLAA